MAYKYLCEGCFNVQTEQPSFRFCEYCEGQQRRLKRLQATIINEHPQMRKLSMAGMFEKLYEAYKKEITK